jgi:hypothetical protein
VLVLLSVAQPIAVGISGQLLIALVSDVVSVAVALLLVRDEGAVVAGVSDTVCVHIAGIADRVVRAEVERVRNAISILVVSCSGGRVAALAIDDVVTVVVEPVAHLGGAWMDGSVLIVAVVADSHVACRGRAPLDRRGAPVLIAVSIRKEPSGSTEARIEIVAIQRAADAVTVEIHAPGFLFVGDVDAPCGAQPSKPPHCAPDGQDSPPKRRYLQAHRSDSVAEARRGTRARAAFCSAKLV